MPLFQTAGNKVKKSGFTLIELLVTLIVAIVLATIAVPGFQEIVKRNRIASDYNEIMAGIAFSRSAAVTRRGEVTVILTSGGSGNGWLLEVVEGDGSVVVSCPSDEACLKVIDNLDSFVHISLNPSGGMVTFDPLGRVDQPLGVEVTSGGYQRCIEIGIAGSVKSLNGACSDA